MRTKIIYTKYKIQNTKELKQFVSEFNFPDPSWENLPSGFPEVSKKGLNREQSHLLDAIILAWTATNPTGKSQLFAQVRLGFISLFFLIGFISLITLIVMSPQEMIIKPANAAGIKIDQAIESTMSAILRK